MLARRRPRRSAAFVAIASIALAGSVLAGSVAAVTTTKPYHVDIAPDVVSAGSRGPYTVTITNDANQPVLGSANWTINSAFTNIDNVVLPAGATLEGPVGSVLMLRNLNIAANTSKAFSYEATAPCEGGTYASSVSAKQSNDYKGPPGNDFVLDTTPPDPISDLGVFVSDACQLAFAFAGDAAPADSQINTNITTEIYDPFGDPIKVVILDGSGLTVASDVEATVTLSIPAGSNPGGGTLTGDLTEDTVNGVATFARTPDTAGALTIDVSGLEYRLRASGNLLGVTYGDSPPFNVQDVGMICQEGSCSSGPVPGKEFPSAEYFLDAEAAAGDLLTVGVETSEEITCSALGFTPHTDTITTDFTGDGTKTLTMTFTNTRKEPKSSFRVCYSQPDLETAWTDRFGVEQSGPDESYLADCSKTSPADTPPCVISVDSDPTKPKTIIIKVLLPEGDPKGRG